MRSVVIDALSGREIVAGSEERDATQPFIFYLTQRLGWNPRQIITRPQWRVPKSPSAGRSAGYPVDIAIFDSPEHAGDPAHIRIIVECKAPDEKQGIRELKTYLGLEPDARLGIWFNGQRHVLVWKVRGGFAVDKYGPVPRPADPLSRAEAHPPLRYKDLVPPPNLREIFRRLRDRIAAQDTHVNRDEFILNDLANLLICKIADEQEGEVEPDRPMAFQLAGSREAIADGVRSFFEGIKGRLTSVFTDADERLHIDDASLEEVVRTLQPYQLLEHDRHAVGTAFQVLRGRALKGDEGAYFTPPPLVDCVISILDPDHGTRLIDPACGTGGFLAAALDHVFSGIDSNAELGDRAKRNAKQRWAANSIFAVDKDAVSTKLCKAYLTLLGDGRSHVYRADTIDRSDWSARSDDLEAAEVNFLLPFVQLEAAYTNRTEFLGIDPYWILVGQDDRAGKMDIVLGRDCDDGIGVLVFNVDPPAFVSSTAGPPRRSAGTAAGGDQERASPYPPKKAVRFLGWPASTDKGLPPFCSFNLTSQHLAMKIAEQGCRL